MIGISKELDDFFYQVERESILWFREKIVSLFPNLPEEYYADCTLLLDILFKGYLATLIREPGAFDTSCLPEFIYNWLESIIVGFSITRDFLLDNTFLFNSCMSRDSKKEIERILDQVIRMEKGPSKRLDTYQAIRQEVTKPKSSIIILESLMLLLENNVEKKAFTQNVIDEIKRYCTSN